MEAALVERNTHSEALEEEVTTLKRRVEASTAAGARVAELEQEKEELVRELEVARESLADLEPLRKSEAEARAQAERLAARLARIREALEEGE